MIENPTGTLVGTRGRQALWWARHHEHDSPAAALAHAHVLAHQLAGLPHLAGWTFVVRDEPEQHRVTVIGTAPRG